MAPMLAFWRVTSAAAVLWLQPTFTGPTPGQLTRLFHSAGAVYDLAILIEQYRVERGVLPKAINARDLFQARFGKGDFADLATDGWGTALHIESTPGKGYLVVAAGADRKFDRASWSRREETRSTTDDIVLRDGVLVRSPVAWATTAASDVRGLDAGTNEAAARLRHQRTVANLRTIASAVLTYEIERNQVPPAKTIVALAQTLGSNIPLSDGWERPFHVAIDGRQWLVVSAGPDGRLDPKSWADNTAKSDDVVLRNGEIARNEAPPEASTESKLAEAIAGYKALRARFEAMRKQ
jgi:hypothetical protein